MSAAPFEVKGQFRILVAPITVKIPESISDVLVLGPGDNQYDAKRPWIDFGSVKTGYVYLYDRRGRHLATHISGDSTYNTPWDIAGNPSRMIIAGLDDHSKKLTMDLLPIATLHPVDPGNLGKGESSLVPVYFDINTEDSDKHYESNLKED